MNGMVDYTKQRTRVLGEYDLEGGAFGPAHRRTKPDRRLPHDHTASGGHPAGRPPRSSHRWRVVLRRIRELAVF